MISYYIKYQLRKNLRIYMPSSTRVQIKYHLPLTARFCKWTVVSSKRTVVQVDYKILLYKNVVGESPKDEPQKRRIA